MAFDERRAKVRFPLELKVRYRTLGRQRPVFGVGLALNMCSKGVLVASQHDIPLGARVRLNIQWPAQLDWQTPLQLVVVGRVARRGASTFVLKLERYQFRTVRNRVQPTISFVFDSVEQTAQKAASA